MGEITQKGTKSSGFQKICVCVCVWGGIYFINANMAGKKGKKGGGMLAFVVVCNRFAM